MHRSRRPGGREGESLPAARRPMSGSHEKTTQVSRKVAAERREAEVGAGHLPARERSVNSGGERRYEGAERGVERRF